LVLRLEGQKEAGFGDRNWRDMEEKRGREREITRTEELRKEIPLVWRETFENRIFGGELLSLNEVQEKLGDLWPRNEDTTGRRFITLKVVPESQGDLDNEASNSLKENDNNGKLGSDTGIIDSPDLGLGKDAEIELCGGVGPLRSRTNGFQLLMPICPSDNLGKETRELLDGEMLGEPMIVDPVRTIRCIPDECRIL